MFKQCVFIICTIAIIQVISLQCYADEKLGRKETLEYFLGKNDRNGYLLSSWKGEKKSQLIKYRRVALGIDETWEYNHEELEIKDLERHEYFVRYTLIFDKKGAEFYTREETYYSTPDELYMPILLKLKDYIIDAKTESYKIVNSKTVWKGDFAK